jgi:hypothetical protein
VHIAPPTRTASVHSNPQMQQRQRLTAHLGIETFDPDTTDAIAGAILVHDLRNPAAPANPATPLGHPHEAFMFAANPGGRWRVLWERAGQTAGGALRGLGPAAAAVRRRATGRR